MDGRLYSVSAITVKSMSPIAFKEKAKNYRIFFSSKSVYLVLQKEILIKIEQLTFTEFYFIYNDNLDLTMIFNICFAVGKPRFDCIFILEQKGKFHKKV